MSTFPCVRGLVKEIDKATVAVFALEDHLNAALNAELGSLV